MENYTKEFKNNFCMSMSNRQMKKKLFALPREFHALLRCRFAS